MVLGWINHEKGIAWGSFLLCHLLSLVLACDRMILVGMMRVKPSLLLHLLYFQISYLLDFLANL
jgi:hypothetical protein